MDDPHSKPQVSVPHEEGIHVTRAVTIARPIDDLYAFWHDSANLPTAIGYIEAAQTIDERHARWTLKLPGGMKADLEMEIIQDVPDEVIGWRSLPDSQIAHAGSVRFVRAPGDRGSEVHLTLEFVPPGGAIGQGLAKLFGAAPKVYVGQMLREFKQVMEAGEKPTTEGQPSGREKEAEMEAQS